MTARAKLLGAAVAAACASPAAFAQSAAQGELVVITVTPLVQRVMDEQRRESLFRALDANGDGQVSLAESGVNMQLLNAFRKLDANGNRSIDRQEFARVHVDDGSTQASAGGPSTSSSIDERAKGYGPQKSEQGAAAGGGIAIERPPLPSRSIEERSKYSIPGESTAPNNR
jgi:hypothetical protein